jgi:hypothetical protein
MNDHPCHEAIIITLRELGAGKLRLVWRGNIKMAPPLSLKWPPPKSYNGPPPKITPHHYQNTKIYLINIPFNGIYLI